MAINISYVSVIDSIASPASTFYAINSTNAGNNTNWTFLTSLNASASISSAATLSITYNPNVWNDVPVVENTWIIQG